MPFVKTLFCLAAAGTLALAGCAPTPRTPSRSDTAESTAPQRGSVVAIEPLGSMDRARLQALAADFPGKIAVAHGAQLYRIVYRTVLHDKPVGASGLFSVPDVAAPPKGVVIYLHGTSMTRALSPSQPDRADGDQETAVFAGNGYYVAVPDYVGLGVSTLPQAYIVAQVQVDASLDMLRAVRAASATLGRPWAPSLYMMGFSQGGQTVAGLHRALERTPLADYRLRGSVGIAGPYELRDLVRRKLAPGRSASPNDAGYLAFIATAYATHYRRTLDELLKPEYAAKVPALFDGTKEPADLGEVLPGDARDLLRPDVLRALEANEDTWFTRALDANETYRWAPKVPLRLYFGDADTDVPPEPSRAFFDYATAHGGSVTLHPLGAVDHSTSAALTYAPALAWFEELGATH